MGAACKPGPKNLITDVIGLRVGNAENTEIKTGTTVLLGDDPFTASVHVMGGAPGTRETDLLAPDKTVDQIDALVLSGGSAFGLDACSGVTDGLRDRGRGFAIGSIRVPIVPGAIIFDLINGGSKDWGRNPYYDLGRSALDASAEDFAIGSVGAGTGALTATVKGGLGSASMILETGYSVGALVVANPLGRVTTSDNRHFWAAPFEIGDEFGARGICRSPMSLDRQTSPKERAMQLADTAMSNTTIAIVATDAPLSKAQCHRLAVNAHDGMSRAIVPSHTPLDGDLVFGVATGRGHTDHATCRDLGFAAAICLSRAIARGVYAATPHKNDLLPCFN